MKRLIAFALLLNASLLVLAVHQLVAIAGEEPEAELNGDTNGDGERDISDATYYLRWLFQGGPEPVAFAGGPDHSAELAELRASIAALRTEVEVASSDAAAAITSNAAAIAEGSEAITSIAVALEDSAAAIGNNAAAIAGLAANPAGGLGAEQAEMLGHMSIEQLPTDDAGNTAKTIRFSGVNVQVVNGTGSTGGDGNGLGNLVVGYQELRTADEDDETDDTNDRSGSHNLVVGLANNYSIFAGQVVGGRNTISGLYSTVSGGENNTASGREQHVP